MSTRKNIWMCFYLVLTILSCNQKSLPQKKAYSFYHNSKIEYLKDSVVIKLNNPINAPLTYFLSTKSKTLKNILKSLDTITLRPLQDSIIVLNFKNNGDKINLKNVLGNPSLQINKYPIALPFKNNSEYTIIQGYKGKFSHTRRYSYYAIDFNLKIGDTICASDNGYVVGVLDKYSGYGNREWMDYANFVTLYHPKSNLYTQYVHLKTNGSLVKVGDTVKIGQPIAISGMTGFTTIPHLHFNVLKATPTGLISEKISFIEGYKGVNLKKNDIVKK
ncbi:M23 family metallopeptidase [Flavivirga abyssicola]|uniref:M23 family metallopeptidase n=1 Tax=Flavivirga abyssicola TaxID=3063533 RepID=UPI0026E0EE92|nr:M23 family metallopeptidase [Flavivirga sp. MEBiC07777]WVK12576.1 M23 family metallopeptidase [Flavivirga sp. MEBiC07777]